MNTVQTEFTAKDLRELVLEDLAGVVLPNTLPVELDDVVWYVGEKSGVAIHVSPYSSEGEGFYSGITGQTSYTSDRLLWSSPKALHYPVSIDGELRVQGQGGLWEKRWQPECLGRKPEYEAEATERQRQANARERFGYAFTQYPNRWKTGGWLGFETKPNEYSQNLQLTHVLWEGEWINRNSSDIEAVADAADEMWLRKELCNALYAYHRGFASDEQCEWLEAHAADTERIVGKLSDDAEKEFLCRIGMTL